MAIALLIASLAALYWFQRNDVRNFQRFREVEDTKTRQRAFLRWAAGACAMFLGVPLIGLATLGRFDALTEFPEEFWSVALEVPAIQTGGVAMGAAIGAVIGGAIAGALIALRRGKAARPPKGMDITPLLPRNRAELLHVVPLAINAGISEEIFFRVYLPLLLVLAGVPGWIAFVASALIFGAMHRYQGVLGVAVTLVLGMVFTALYLASGGLLVPILFHLLINANALLFRPAVQLRFRRPAD
ncbi:MAG: CPBP family intramembrane metalloprotease [Sphingomonas sp.]|uniref:CPBP family intramembrane glutamic endopeptidase n=1 Tax=Sphingomonas sp. TaxID=28214 RepID=UPI0025F04CCB|nr:CPBP family intramembrane glutamic endopeptidase [Sphingomonas sp.]MBX3563146.1 CPBP family intramembrane metalloprotease [Sphingomonas sp.]